MPCLSATQALWRQKQGKLTAEEPDQQASSRPQGGALTQYVEVAGWWSLTPLTSALRQRQVDLSE